VWRREEVGDDDNRLGGDRWLGEQRLHRLHHMEDLASAVQSESDLDTAVTDLKQAEATMVAALGSAVASLKGFSPSGELEQAFKDSPSCAVYF